jgi:crossover junction endodeoxyribonuclease RuvC
MLVLGIDPGSVKCGYGLVRANGLSISYVEAGVLTAPESWTKYARLAEIGKELVAILGEHVVDAVAIEAGFIVPFRRKGTDEIYSQQGALVSAAARGMAGYIAATRGIQVFEYAPAAVKKAATGEGSADKAQVARAIKLRLGMKAEPAPDAADALAIAICHAMQAAIGRRKAA